MTQIPTTTSSKLLLRSIFLAVTILALVFAAVDFFMTRYHYLNNDGMLLEVQINKIGSEVKTWNSVDIGGNEFNYGATGTLNYQPKTLYKAVLYGFYSRPGSPTKIIDCFFVFCIGLYLFISSFYISEKEFFNERTYIMFICLVFLAILLMEGRSMVMSSIDDMFFQDTGDMFRFYTKKDGQSVTYVMNFIFILFTIIFARAQKVQKEQELTI